MKLLIYKCAQPNTNYFFTFQLQIPPSLLNLLLLSDMFLFIHTNIFYTNFFTEFPENSIFSLWIKTNRAKNVYTLLALTEVKHLDNNLMLWAGFSRYFKKQQTELLRNNWYLTFSNNAFNTNVRYEAYDVQKVTLSSWQHLFIPKTIKVITMSPRPLASSVVPSQLKKTKLNSTQDTNQIQQVSWVSFSSSLIFMCYLERLWWPCSIHSKATAQNLSFPNYKYILTKSSYLIS